MPKEQKLFSLKKIVQLTLLLFLSSCNHDNARNSSEIVDLAKNQHFKAAISKTEYFDKGLKHHVLQFINYKQTKFFKQPDTTYQKPNELIVFFSNTNKGIYSLYKKGELGNASEYFDIAIESAKAIGNPELLKEAYWNKIKFYDIFSTLTDDRSHLIYLKQYQRYISNSYDSIFYDLYNFRLTQRITKREEFVYDLKKLNKLDQRISKYGDSLLLAHLRITMASIHFNYENNIDLAFDNLKSVKSISENQDNLFYKRVNYTAQINEARYNRKVGKIELSKNQLTQIKLSNKPFFTDDLQKFYLWNKWKIHEEINSINPPICKTDSALFYKTEYYKKIAYILYENARQQSALNLSERQEIENDEIKKEKNNWILGSTSFILFMSLLGSLTLKNSRRKRLLALQEKELETQKNLTLLKEQEILAINSMVEGQEKERKRVAEDLHDNLGSVIATLKLHFDNLRGNRERKKVDQETLYNKTENLIDEAYQKVRSIAHAKNAGVIANQGLLVAVKLMAEKVSSANTIQIEVIDHGLEKPLENSLEIALFRIIQELTTNIIKHAQANDATINISQDEEDIMVIIEDNGIGMNASQIDLKKGMGLHSIKTRVEHLEGSFTIDSTPTKGTTIIINIPT